VALSYRIKYSHISHCHWDWKPSNDSWSVLIATIMHSAAPSATRLDYCHSLSKAIMLWHNSRCEIAIEMYRKIIDRSLIYCGSFAQFIVWQTYC